MEFDTGIIPSGSYVKIKIENWTNKVHMIKQIFVSLAKECEENGYIIDSNRPSIEFYKSLKELIIMIPIK